MKIKESYVQIFIYSFICVLIGVLIYFAWSYVKNGKNSKQHFDNVKCDDLNIEGFINDSSKLDLLNKQTSNNITSTITNTDGSTIAKWSNKFYNMQTLTQLKPLSFWKPKIPVSGGKQMYKLGDMLSQDSLYAPPTNSSLFVSGDVKSPTDYTTVIKFTGLQFNPFYNELDNYVNNVNDLGNIITSLKTTVNAIPSINSLLQSGMPDIIAMLNESIINKVNAGIGSTTFSLNVLQSQNNSTINKIISPTDTILLPVGSTISLFQQNTDDAMATDSIPIILNLNMNLNMNFNNDQNNNYQNNNDQKNNISYITGIISSKKYFGNIGLSNVSIIPISVSLMTVPSVSSILHKLITDISSEIETFKTAQPDLAKYLNLDSIVPNLTSFLTTNFTFTYNYVVVSMSVNDISNINFNPTAFQISTFDPLLIPKTLNNLFFPNDITQAPKYVNSQLSKFMNNTILLSNLGNKIGSSKLDLFSFTILAPIAPTNYMSLGHIFVNSTDKIENIKNNNTVGCIPKTCVKEIREWLNTDMIFEYNKGNVYFNVFYNPFVGTFIVNTRRGVPDGKVCKVVACVKQCTIVDEIIKADKCARNFQTINKSLTNDKPLTLSLSTNAEDEFYLNKISKQSNQIAKLQMTAQQMQIAADKLDIVNREYNKSKLQNLVDTQKRNINLVADRLDTDRNKIDIELNIPLDVINNITKMIHNSPNIPNDVKQNLISKIINNKTMADSSIITGVQYKANLNKILQSCQDYDMQGFVKKDLAREVCYGCDNPM